MADHDICSIEGCEGTILARGWCRLHYQRWYKHHDPLAVSQNCHKPLKWLLANITIESDACLFWPFGRTGMGYAAFYPGVGHQVMAHRWVCERAHGPHPNDKKWAAHSCGNGHLGCVNPRHLRWATPKENGEDRVAHGNSKRGPENHNTKLKEADALAIYRSDRALSYREVGRRFGVSSGAVSGIRTGRTWAWLTGAQRAKLA